MPNPVFGMLLEEIDDLAELKCTLRLLWLIHQKKGFPRFIALKDLLADRVLARALANGGHSAEKEIRRGLDLAVRRSVFLSRTIERGGIQHQVYVLNTDSDRRALADAAGGEPDGEEAAVEGPGPGDDERPNIYGMYEDNIGMLNPMIAEELKEAEEVYPQAWVEDAFREAVTHNKRSWRYVAAILERWEREGRSNGGSGRHPKTADHERYLGR